MIIWSGWGITVPIVAAVAFLVVVTIAEALGVDGSAVSIGVAGVIAGVGIFFLARAIESREGRVFIDEATQERVEVRPSAGSLFFVPTRYWAFIMPVVAVALAVMVATTPPSAEAAPAVDAPVTAPSGGQAVD